MADNRRYVYDRLRRELGLKAFQAAGAVGGLGGESGKTLDPNAVNPTTGALGIGQWLGGRKRGVQKGNLRQQVDHLIAELKGPERGALNALRNARNIDQATSAWVRQFERPSPAEIRSSMPARLQYARQAFNAFGSGDPGPVASTSGGGRGSGSSTRTITETIPGVDNRAARFQLVQQFLGEKGSDPLDFALQVRALQDIPDTTTTRTVSSGSSRGGGGAPRPASGGGGGGALPGLQGKGSGVFELFYDPQGGWKYGKQIGAIGGHSDHVHVAAGPKTIVALGELAQKMGLHVGENPHFGGVAPVHVSGSFHYKDEAIDVSGDTAKMAAYARRIRRLYGLG